MIWIRATLPRIRYDRLMAFGWKLLFPLALANVLITATGIVLAQDYLYTMWLIPILTLLVFILTSFLVRGALAGGNK